MTSKATNAQMNDTCYYDNMYVGGGEHECLRCNPTPAKLRSVYDDAGNIIAVYPSTYSEGFWSEHERVSVFVQVFVGVILCIAIALIVL